MNDRQRRIVDAATEKLAAHVTGLDREQLSALLYQLALDVLRPPATAVPDELRHGPVVAGEVLPPHQRATWARGKTEHDR